GRNHRGQYCNAVRNPPSFPDLLCWSQRIRPTASCAPTAFGLLPKLGSKRGSVKRNFANGLLFAEREDRLAGDLSLTALLLRRIAMANTAHLRTMFGIKLSRLRDARRLTLSALAGQAGVSISYLAEIEAGKKFP